MKLYVLFSVLVLGILGWIIVEVRHRRKVNESVIFRTLYQNLNLLSSSVTRRRDFALSSRTARAQRPTQGSRQCRRRTMSTTSWRRILWSRTCKSGTVTVLCNKFLPHTRGSFPLPKIYGLCLSFCCRRKTTI